MVQYGRGTGPANSCARVLATADEGLAIYQFAARFWHPGPTGEAVWEINLGSPVTGFPITFAVDGRQYVAASAKGQGQGPGRSCACGKC